MLVNDRLRHLGRGSLVKSRSLPRLAFQPSLSKSVGTWDSRPGGETPQFDGNGSLQPKTSADNGVPSSETWVGVHSRQILSRNSAGSRGKKMKSALGKLHNELASLLRPQELAAGEDSRVAVKI